MNYRDNRKYVVNKGSPPLKPIKYELSNDIKNITTNDDFI